MKLPEFSVNRPVTTSMFFIGVLMLGFISLTRLPQELFPSITYPQLTVVTSYENAAPDEVESLITKIIEETVGTVSNVKRVSSVSKEGISIVTVDFGWGTSMDFASLGVREKIDLIKERLPLGSSDPIVMKFNPFELPVISLSITGDKPPAELLRLSRRFIKDELEKVEGVASCNVSGGLEREILVSIDEGRLRASNISITEVVVALRSSNLNYPAGTIEEHFYEYLIRTMGEYKIVQEVGETIVGKDESEKGPFMDPRQLIAPMKQTRLIHLKDIAKIEDTFQEKTSISRYNGEENISIAVQKQAAVNTLRVAKKVRERLVKIKPDLPSGLNVDIVYDQSVFIERSIRGVMEAAIQGGILAFLVLFIFLKNIKASIIVASSMPISIMVTFTLMYFNGITINMLSLGGLALGIGMLVDSAIVVIENIYRHLHMGKGVKDASKSGANEVSGAIFSSTFTTVAVFLPMIFVVGVAGQLFKELAFTVTFSLLASLIVALSLIPRLTAIGGTGRKPMPNLDVRGETSNKRISTTFGLGPLYLKAISNVLKYRWIFLIAVLVVFILSMGLFVFIDKEFMPKVDQREFIIKVGMPSGTKLQITDNIVGKIEKALLDTGETDGIDVSIGSSKKKDLSQGLETMGSHQAQIMVTLKKGKKLAPTSTIVKRLKKSLATVNLEGAEIDYILQESVFKSALQGAAPIIVEVKGKDLRKIEDVARYIRDGLSGIEGIYGIRTSLTTPSPETKVNVIKDRVALYNLSTAEIAKAAHTAMKGVVATRFKEEGREIDVRVRLRKEGRAYLSQLRNILVHSPLGIEVPLSEVAYITQGQGPSEIRRLDQQKVVLVTANIVDRALDKVIMDIDALIERTEREKIKRLGGSTDTERDINITLSGESQQMGESFDSLRFALILSILMVYMIMASQFESLWQPFIIMCTVPLSLIGALAILFLTRTPISVVVMLGVIMLGGIVVNNGIILIDSINSLRKKGIELMEAVVESGKIRLRPIFMTTMTTVLGLLPLALGIAEGSELQSPMAITVMGGLTLSTILTLFVIPCVYVIVAGIIERRPALKTVPLSKIQLHPEQTKAITLPLPPIKAKPPEPERPRPKIKPLIIKKVPVRPETKAPSPTVPLSATKPPVHEKASPTALPRFNKRQKQLVEHLKKVKRISRKEYAIAFKISVPTAARDLKELLDKGILVANGPLGPGRWYELKSDK